MNLSEAIDFLDAVSDFHFKESEKKPDFLIYDNQKEGFVLCVKASLVGEKYRCFLGEIVKSRKLGMRESKGYLIIHG
jgi:hypothetical protein